MSRWSRYILFAGIVLGVVVGAYMGYIGWNLHPMVFEMDSGYAVIIFLSWFIVVLCPFALIAGIVKIWRLIKEKPWKTRQ